MGQKFGLAGESKADFGQPGLGDRGGDQRGGMATQRQRRALGQRGQRHFGARAVGHAGAPRPIGPGQHRQRAVETFGGLFGSSNGLDRHGRAEGPRCGGQQTRAADREERRKAGLDPARPCRQKQFGANPGRIAERDGQRVHRVNCSR